MTKEIYLAGGCFWGCQKFFSLLPGIISTEVGYANGHGGITPTYELVCSGATNFAEVLKVEYDSQKIDLNFVLENFYKIINPTTLNKQGPDIGTQYRSGIYYTNKTDEPIITSSLLELQKEYNEPIVVENMPLKNYFRAEDYHQDYLDKNPNGYCHIGEDKFELARACYIGEK